jgi:hypothetical protein
MGDELRKLLDKLQPTVETPVTRPFSRWVGPALCAAPSWSLSIGSDWVPVVS